MRHTLKSSFLPSNGAIINWTNLFSSPQSYRVTSLLRLDLDTIENFYDEKIEIRWKRGDCSSSVKTRSRKGRHLDLGSALTIFPSLNAPLRIRISYVRHDARLLRARALRHNRISKTRCAPLCRPLRLTSALFTPGQTGNSISTNYHSFRKKDKCKREPNRCGRHAATTLKSMLVT